MKKWSLFNVGIKTRSPPRSDTQISGRILCSGHLCGGIGPGVNSAPGIGETAKWMHLLLQEKLEAALLTETGSWQEGASVFLPPPAYQSPSSFPCWQRWKWSQLDEQKWGLQSRRCSITKQNRKRWEWAERRELKSQHTQAIYTYGWFSNVWGIFSISWISSFIPLWSGNTLNDFSPLLFI